ncbi:hypothetical protein IU433_14365 [Nocardia puris]|uniref:Uncharacterized protein n=1 Tax=Nocardia puris TaxID=208602 RepID=A0A366DDC0_9NOCA|nr:hypothetical protein [Nocardia puris]MBF6364780.1 hypothetical protein [Nocardia puris]MBF6460221.1 hypothetical protein [Nocardia puris]RBO87935.1 hypothetical protein DFR74_110190 [Nocardia puris]
MGTRFTNRDDSRLAFWLRVREYAVPPTMIETATARRHAGDWVGACAAAGFDTDINPRAVARVHGTETAAQLRADLRHLAPDLLRWHLPRVAPDGLLRPGLTIALARYGPPDLGKHCGAVYLVARTAPAWADAGQRITLALWDGSDTGPHPHPRPNRRFRLDLHRHLWDARRTSELRIRSGADKFEVLTGPYSVSENLAGKTADLPEGCAIHTWASEAEILLRAEGRPKGLVRVRFGARREVVAEVSDDKALRIADPPRGTVSGLPLLPDASVWTPPDLELLRAGAITADRLHPLIAEALAPDRTPITTAPPDRTDRVKLVECRGEQHRIGLSEGVLTALDHDPAEIRREELLAALTGAPLPCLRAIDRAHRHPDCLTGVRERLDHGDTAGALAVVEGLLGPDAVLRDGPLRDELELAAQRRITYGLFKAGLIAAGPTRVRPDARRRDRRAHPRHATTR